VPPFLDQCVLATQAVPRSGGTVDLLGASWDTIPAGTVPVQQNGFALLLSVLLEPAEAKAPHVIDVAIISEAGERLSGVTLNLDPVADEALAALGADEYARMETVLGASGIEYPDYGRYKLTISWDGEELRRPMFFKVVPAPPGESPETND
jgi:hypothetical protein